MAESSTPNPFARSVVLRVPAAESVHVTPDLPWGDAGRVFDLYRTPDAADPLAVVVLVTGFPDPHPRRRDARACPGPPCTAS